MPETYDEKALNQSMHLIPRGKVKLKRGEHYIATTKKQSKNKKRKNRSIHAFFQVLCFFCYCKTPHF